MVDPLKTEFIVTGANGLVGLEVLRSLRCTYPNIPIKALIRNEPRERLSGISYLKGELPQSIPEQLFERSESILFHFASLLKAKHLSAYRKTNVEGTEKLLASGGSRIKKIIYGSSMSVYGQGPFYNLNEEVPTKPETELAISRWEAETAIKEHCAKFNTQAFILRPRFILGNRDKETLPALFKLHHKGLLIGDGNQKFSFIDVDDYAQIISHLTEQETSGAEVINVAYKEALALNDIFDSFGPYKLRAKIPASLLISLGRWIPPFKKLRIKLQLIGQNQVLNVERLGSRFPLLSTMDAKEKLNQIIKVIKTLHET
jgi:nucleoside-diphosphate-sugar epimerase